MVCMKRVSIAVACVAATFSASSTTAPIVEAAKLRRGNKKGAAAKAAKKYDEAERQRLLREEEAQEAERLLKEEEAQIAAAIAESLRVEEMHKKAAKQLQMQEAEALRKAEEKSKYINEDGTQMNKYQIAAAKKREQTLASAPRLTKQPSLQEKVAAALLDVPEKSMEDFAAEEKARSSAKLSLKIKSPCEEDFLSSPSHFEFDDGHKFYRAQHMKNKDYVAFQEFMADEQSEAVYTAGDGGSFIKMMQMLSKLHGIDLMQQTRLRADQNKSAAAQATFYYYVPTWREKENAMKFSKRQGSNGYFKTELHYQSTENMQGKPGFVREFREAVKGLGYTGKEVLTRSEEDGHDYLWPQTIIRPSSPTTTMTMFPSSSSESGSDSGSDSRNGRHGIVHIA